MVRSGMPGGELTSAQRQIWVGQKLAPRVPLYNIPFTFRLRGALEESRFAAAFSQCVEASDVLRTVFEEHRERPTRVVRSDVQVPLERLDLSGEQTPELAARALIADRARRPFDLASSLVDSMLIKLAPSDHIWFLNQHHLVTDAWSTSLFFRQVETRYRALASGRSLVPPPLFEEHVTEERQRYGAIDESRSADGPERKRRAERPAALYGVDNESRSTASERHVVELGAARSRRLRATATEPGVRSLTPEMSLFNIFATVAAALLYRATGDGDGALGTPVLNRLSPRLQETLGLFIELHPFDARVGAGDTFEELLARVQLETNRLLLASPSAEPGTTARRDYNVVLNYLTVTFPSFDGHPVEVEWWDSGHCDAGHHLRIQVHDFDAGGNLSVLFDFNREVFREERRGWLIHHFNRLLDSFLDDRTLRIADADLAHPEERAPQLGEPSTPVTGSTATSLTTEFARVARSRPDASAVSAADGTLSYAELDARSTDVARRLLGAGVQPGDRVGLAAERHTATVCGLLGILKARAAYLPIAPDHPATRTSFVLADCGVETVIAAAPLPGWDGRRIDPTKSLDHRSPPPDGAALEPAVANDLTYVLYTSGSTGRPKGVLVEHRQVLSLVHGLEKRVYREECPGLRVAMLAPFVFDASVQQIFAALLLGHELVLVPEKTRLDGGALLDFFHRWEIDLSDGTPAHLALLARAPGGRDSIRVRHFLIGGEELRPSILHEFYSRFPAGDPIVTNVYGPTECCVDSTSFRVTRGTLDQLDTRVPLGRPMPGERVYVMSGSTLQPLGAPGELCIAGAGVGRGYQGRREESRAFGEDPFYAGERLYRTGDFGRYRPDGEIEFLGRRDSQVKVRGYRIELAEVQGALESFEQSLHQPMAVTAIRRPTRRCSRCVLSAGYPGIQFDDEGVCDRCREFERFRPAADDYFRSFDELRPLLEAGRGDGSGADCLLLYSGGKDSSYVLHRLVEMGLEVVAFTFDNGFISPAAFDNIRRQTSRLGVESIVTQTPRMDAIFVESLARDQTVCTGCFKALTTISTRLAADRGIRPILTGLSRGQIFETKIEGLFRSGVMAVDEVESDLRDFRKLYHAQKDRVSDLLDLSADEVDLGAHEFIDFFRYDSTPVPEIKAFLARRDSFWSQPQDTGFCSSNCMMNDIGICVHSRELGYHNYEAPLSWDIRLGVLGREAALAEVESDIDVDRVNKVLKKIGYLSKTLDDVAVVVREDAPGGGHVLCAYFTSNHAVGLAELRAYLAETLPEYMIPQHFVQLPALPLTANGKVDTVALPPPAAMGRADPRQSVAPASQTEEYIAAVWSEVLDYPIADVGRSFFEYGGASLQAMEVMARICDTFDIDLSLQELFDAPTVRQLAARVDRTVERELAELGDQALTDPPHPATNPPGA